MIPDPRNGSRREKDWLLRFNGRVLGVTAGNGAGAGSAAGSCGPLEETCRMTGAGDANGVVTAAGSESFFLLRLRGMVGGIWDVEMEGCGDAASRIWGNGIRGFWEGGAKRRKPELIIRSLCVWEWQKAAPAKSRQAHFRSGYGNTTPEKLLGVRDDWPAPSLQSKSGQEET